MKGLTQPNSKEKGAEAENTACIYLEKNNIRVVQRNVTYKFGEIDIVAKDRDVLCFIEVRSRFSVEFGRPEATVGPRKQSQIIRAASAYLQSNFVRPPICRFDVVAIVGCGDAAEIRYFKNAFGVLRRFGGVRGSPWQQSYR